ncbi:hypothetical protein GCWB2_19040 [Gordonia rubripertincta]|nr:hypothetical protein GCWB2_19040 [Gordonia rubripertincta]
MGKFSKHTWGTFLSLVNVIFSDLAGTYCQRAYSLMQCPQRGPKH